VTLDRQIEALLGEAPVARRTLTGGDLSAPLLLTLASGRRVVVKRGPRAGAESRMLRALTAAGVPVPAVLGVSGDCLVIEFVADARPLSGPSWEGLGHTLRRLHDATADAYGWPEDHGFGAVAIANGQHADWPDFWVENRIVPLAARHVSPARLRSLTDRLSEVLPERPPPSLLHGDLWGGNVLARPDGGVVLIDPACYHGHAEVDLAMLSLFDTPPPEFWAAYGPPAPGWALRRAAYQLWPALVHRALFGAGYDGMVARLLDDLGI
jgi:fructosamine-3-kinase